MTIHEPATLLTDLLLAVLATGLGGHLWRSTGSAAARWCALALAGTAVSALVGGLYHGFAPNFAPEIARAWWTFTLLGICLTALAMDLALLHETVARGRRRPGLVAIALKAAIFSGGAIVQPAFVVVIVNYGLTLVAWTIAAVRGRQPWRGAMLLGIGLSLGAAAVQQLRIGLSPRFNHNDLYHVIQAVALVAFALAGRRFADHAPAA
ncbi:MAG TPA: hypothetical protein VEB66_11730 [Opitutaceae bacterium]|nr:hypothetical protein [Opitutaceae bacterium]